MIRNKTALLAAITAATSAFAQDPITPQMRQLWENPITESRIETGIRANRMGEFYLNFDQPVENLEIKLSRHEFLFGVYASRSVADGQPTKYTKEQVDKYADLYKRIFNYGTISTVWRKVEPQEGKFRWDYSNDEKHRPFLHEQPHGNALRPHARILPQERNHPQGAHVFLAD